MMISIFIQAVCIQCLFWLTYKAIFERYHSFFFNRMFLLVGLLATLIVPWIDVSIPVLEYVTLDFDIVASSESIITSHAESFNWLFIIYAFIGMAFLLSFLWRWNYINQIGEDINVCSPLGYKLFRLPKGMAPFSFWPSIYMSEEDLSDKMGRDLIIRHEEYHLQQLHSFDIILAELLSILLWFSPVSRLYIRSIKNNHEYQVDQHFVEDRNSLNIYLQLLLRQWTKASPSMVSPFDFSTNKNRIVMMQSKSKTLSKTKTSIFCMIIACPLIMMSFSIKTVFIPTDSYASETETVDERIMNISSDTIPTPPPAPVPPKVVKGKVPAAIPPPPPPPPAVRRPSMELMKRWANEVEEFGIWYEGARIENDEVNSLSQKEIYWYNISLLARNAQDFGKYTYHVTIMSKEQFEVFEKESYQLLEEWSKISGIH